MEAFSALLAFCAFSPHKGQWRIALMFSLIYTWINRWVNNREAGDLRRHRAHYDNFIGLHIQKISLPLKVIQYPSYEEIKLWTYIQLLILSNTQMIAVYQFVMEIKNIHIQYIL